VPFLRAPPPAKTKPADAEPKASKDSKEGKDDAAPEAESKGESKGGGRAESKATRAEAKR
jgi:hypothetical protein